MAQLVSNPPAPTDTGPTPTPAPDVQPAGAVDFAALGQAIAFGIMAAESPQVLQAGFVPTDLTKMASDLDKHAARRAFDDENKTNLQSQVLKWVVEGAETVGDSLVDAALTFLDPIKAVFAHLSANYVQHFANEMQPEPRTGIDTGTTATVGTTAAGAFDTICKPLGFMGGGHPEEPGAGAAAVQKVLGSLISLHLNTWVVNVVSNLTGLGYLHYINSFDDVILSAMNTRSMGRLAFKPYMNTYMVDPLVRDLNVAHPLKDTGPGTIVHAYNTGQITQEQFLQRMREKGYAADIAATYLTETVKHPSLSDVAWLVHRGFWTIEVAQHALELQGWPIDISLTVLLKAMEGDRAAMARRVADEVLDEVGQRVMDRETGQQIIIHLDLLPDEETLYMQLLDLLYHRPRRPSYGQVKAMYLASIVDLEYVTTWLEAERYSSDDARSLVLLDFTEGEKRAAHEAQLGAMYRVRSVSYADQAKAALAKANQAKADADARLSSKYAALAARYGG